MARSLSSRGSGPWPFSTLVAIRCRLSEAPMSDVLQPPPDGGVAGQLAEEPLAALHAAEDRVDSEWEISTTLSITSSPEAIRASTLVGCAAGICPSSGIDRVSGEPELISMNLSPSRPRVLMRAREATWLLDQAVAGPTGPRMRAVVLLVDADPDPDVLLLRVLGQDHLLDRPHVDAVELHRAAGLEPARPS